MCEQCGRRGHNKHACPSKKRKAPSGDAGDAAAPFRSAERATRELLKLVQQRPACVPPDGLRVHFASSANRSVEIYFGDESCGPIAVVCLQRADGALLCDCGIDEVALESYSRECPPGQILDEFECSDVDECASSPCWPYARCIESGTLDWRSYLGIAYKN